MLTTSLYIWLPDFAAPGRAGMGRTFICAVPIFAAEHTARKTMVRKIA
jgi:hypothetical protein